MNFDALGSASKNLARAVMPSVACRLYRRRKIAREIEGYRSRQVVHTYCGFQLRLSLEDPLAEGWYDFDWPLLPEIEVLQQHRLTSGVRVFDLGAHQGLVALVLSRIVGEEGSVIAVEAEPHNARVAERNCRLNGAHNLVVKNAVAADREQRFHFQPGLNGRVVSERLGRIGAVGIPGVTTDGLAAEYGPPDVVVVDVEGFEARVLAGSRETIRGQRPDFLVEVHVGCGLEDLDGSVEEVLSFFPEEDYRLFCALDSPDHHYRFEPLDQDSGVMQQRFFLLALGKGVERRASSRTARLTSCA